MGTLFKGLLGIVGIILLIPIALVVIALLIVTLIGGYIGVVVTLWEWIGIVLAILAGLILVKFVVNAIAKIRK